MAKRQLRVGVHEGGGPPPGYEWNVFILDLAYREACGAFNEAQYSHLAQQVQELARHERPSHPATVSVDKIEDFYELRDKGGVLGSLNARVFWGLDKESRAIVVIGAISKQNNGPTPQGDKLRMRRRWRKYMNGDYGEGV